ncbi:MAG TPA: sigma-70 family RNA polymerase sigma factor [Candidatus Aminicenantes bacterium]|nr:sigma-70 family RNA polymerase sigma factor [Candidatus Aminicenantes bacterium]
METDEDQVLIRRVLRGDRKAFEELMRKYERRIYGFVVRMVRNEETAIDLTQDFFIKIYTVLDKYNFEYKFSTWAYRICYNLVIDHIRKHQAQVDSLDDDSVSPRDLLESDNVSREDGFRALARAETRDYVWRVVDQIPLKFRELILLRYIQDLKYEEIAEIMSLPVGTVKNRIFKAKEILKQEMERDGMLV